MADNFLAEIRLVGFNFPPMGWAFCDGQLMAISQNTALFSLLGTTYGGDGKSTFALPNLQGTTVLGAGQGHGLSLYDLGEIGGSEAVTLLQSEIPVHTHTVAAVDALGTTNAPAGNTWASARYGRLTEKTYSAAGAAVATSAAAFAPAGSNRPHNNMPPYLVMNYIIALTGIYPQRP